ncbi:uncharacterized protein LOC120208711 [Hibiscus syriacus]|uniref:uncharacterized protein LOC120208711 n=1 Tax=Hibiscus syriacus TaxID=106335 RepID=UPI001923D581|nr:uncharacterized protein LOC120208711 [Hibiscus syriacus]
MWSIMLKLLRELRMKGLDNKELKHLKEPVLHQFQHHLRGAEILVSDHRRENVVADALSCKKFAGLRALDARLSLDVDCVLCVKLMLRPTLLDRIKELQGKDERCLRRILQVKNEENKDFEIKSDRNLYYRRKLVIPDDEELKNDLLIETQCSPLMIHPGGNKIYMDLKSRIAATNLHSSVEVGECDDGLCDGVNTDLE